MTDPRTAPRLGTLERTADGGVLRFHRHLAFPVAEVWSALTDPARLADWWLPFDADVTVDLRVGGEMRYAAREDDFVLRCTVLRLEPPTLLEHTHGDSGSTVLWRLAEVDGGCDLRVEHHVRDVDEAVRGCWAVGLHTSLERLAPLLAGRPVPWDWAAFAASQGDYAATGLAPAVPVAPEVVEVPS